MRIAPPSERLERISAELRVRGRVQGVGFRPTVWRLARELDLCGEVLNNAEGVLIRATGAASALAALVERLHAEAPPLARIDDIDWRAIPPRADRDFRIATTIAGAARTQVAPDAVVCRDCARDVTDRKGRRHRYAFTNCTHCGPRLTIATAIPFDRATTTMVTFAMCAACRAEYDDPQDRRFHAEAIACADCGPKLRLVRLTRTGEAASRDRADAIHDVAAMLSDGSIVAIKGLGGYQLACDAANERAVLRLRHAKLRPAKPFALMARDLEVLRRYCVPSDREVRELESSEGPIVLLRADGPERLQDAIAPGLRRLGFMLPTTPLHLLLLASFDRPLVMTSGNLSEDPQLIDDEEALRRFAGLADAVLLHDRKIAVRVDDSVVRVVDNVPRVLRRARGYAPSPMRLPPGFEQAPRVLAFGGDQKSTFCLVKDGEAVLSQHQGELENATAFDDFRRNLTFYGALFDHAPRALAADQHPDYRSAKVARDTARRDGLPLIEVQHHHAHVAACLAESAQPLIAPPVLGIVLDGLGWGADGGIWGGEFLLADYCRAERLATFKPVAMLGGDRAAREPWRNLYAHLAAGIGWSQLAARFGDLELCRHLASKPRTMLDRMLHNGINAPLASSCGRLFEAVAAAVGICRERQVYEGQAACELETVAEGGTGSVGEPTAYPFAISTVAASGLPCIDPRPMWEALLRDLAGGKQAATIAARFHQGLVDAILAMVRLLARGRSDHGPLFNSVALSGGCIQNALLFEALVRGLHAEGLTVLSHSRVPANDGGLALGQAAVAAARLIETMPQA